jgi:hypothetical protein
VVAKCCVNNELTSVPAAAAAAAASVAAVVVSPPPQLLGRADNVKEYIKRGCDEGWVETTLSGGPGHPDITVRRDMKKTSADTYTSTWKIDSE